MDYIPIIVIIIMLLIAFSIDMKSHKRELKKNWKSLIRDRMK
jgi:DMSO/TMAO reductase YedYZ heme-binding membrane subunit